MQRRKHEAGKQNRYSDYNINTPDSSRDRTLLTKPPARVNMPDRITQR
jgi:hypothetical protein